MLLSERAALTVDAALQALSADLDDEDKAIITKIIEQSMRDAILEATHQSKTAAVETCGADADMAHKISEEIERKNTGLIANLSSLR
jgi:hypothetical protein